MMAAELIVVAPDVAFRHSLVFILESAGFRVVSHGSLVSAFASLQARHVQCAVVDEEAVDDWLSARRLFSSFARPVIVLVDRVREMPETPIIRYLAKPFLGEPLVDAVQEAIGWISDPDT